MLEGILDEGCDPEADVTEATSEKLSTTRGGAPVRLVVTGIMKQGRQRMELTDDSGL